MQRSALFILAILLPALFAACEQPRAAGDAHAIIVAASEDAWAASEETIMNAMEPTILTVREDRTFRLTYQDPRDPDWGRLQRFRQVLAIGTEEDPWVQEALNEVRPRRSPEPPELLQANNVWARGQVVTIIVAEPGREAEAVEELAEPLHELLDAQYRAYALNRMFVTGRDSVLADSLRRNVGFSVVVPVVYRHSARDSIYRFRNDNPSPAELIREVSVTWKSPIPEDFDDDDLLEWRQRLADEVYQDGQNVNMDRSEISTVQVNARDALQIQASWESGADAWPAAGPFMSRAIVCPEDDRLYLMDGWLYAPGRDKYEYMIQLKTIMDSFRCG